MKYNIVRSNEHSSAVVAQAPTMAVARKKLKTLARKEEAGCRANGRQWNDTETMVQFDFFFAIVTLRIAANTTGEVLAPDTMVQGATEAGVQAVRNFAATRREAISTAW
jgi:hypothetical protein